MKTPPPLVLAVPLTALLHLIWPIIAQAQDQAALPYISEFMADNQGTLLDEDEDAPDWIEIHHPGAETVSLENYSLTDDPENPRKWIFPNLDLEGDAHLVIFASGKDRRSPLGPFLHTNFSLDADGEYLALHDPEGNAVSVFESYPLQAEDDSYGFSAAQRPVNLIDTGSPCRWDVPFGSRSDLEWTTLEFDDGGWFRGESGVGYDFGLDYHEWIQTDISFEMAGFATTALLRFPFEIEDPGGLTGLVMHLRFDDGYVAFLNGERVGSDSAPAELLTDSSATADRPPSDGIQEVTVDLTEHLDKLVAGTNVLAIHGLDASASSGDFYVHPRLEMLLPVESRSYGIMATPTPGISNRESYAGRVDDVVFSTAERYLDESVLLELTTATPGAEIYYSFDGSAPTPANGFLYAEPIDVDETLAVRARAYSDGLLPSKVATRTYVFVDELASQSLLNQAIVGPDREQVEAGMLTGLPILSIAVDATAMFGDGGIDTIPEQTRELPISLEYFSSDRPDDGFQIDAGLAIHGGNARVHPKKPYRLFFRRDYGPARLEYPLFEGSPVASFDQLVLRAGGHDSWSISPDFGSTDVDLPFHATYLRDQFLRQTELEMGALSPRGRYVQVLLNGFYWGIYDLHERPDAAFFSDHLGGKESDWDVLHHADTFDSEWAVIDGSDADWSALHQRVREGIANAVEYEEVQTQLDLDGLIDSLIVRMWSGDYDWAGPIFWLGEEAQFFRNKNWYTGRRGRTEPGFFRFFVWDGEMSMGSHLLSNVFGQSIEQRVLDFDLTAVDDPGTPTGFHGAFRFFPDYRRRFGDRVQKLMVEDGGVLSVSSARERLDVLRDVLDPVMVAESARWGDLHSFQPPFTREDSWRPEVEWLWETFIPQRREIVLEQFEARGLSSPVEAPRVTPPGGSLDEVASIELAGEGGTIYYTVDGTDPATPVAFERRVLVDESSSGHYLIPTIQNGGSTLDSAWKEIDAPPFFDQWTSSKASVGYDSGEDNFYGPHFEVDVSEMSGVNTTLYLRVPFEFTAVDDVESLILRVKYDDGFAAFLNGGRIAAASAPDELTWFSEALFRRADEDALFYRDFDVTATAKGLLQEGTNVLAVQVMNGSIGSSDLLYASQLIAIETTGPASSVPSEAALAYAGPLSFSETTILKARTRTESGVWSNLSEAFYFPGQMAEATSLRISEIHYHPLASEDRGSSAFEFIELTNIAETTVQLGGLRFSEGIEFVFDPFLLEVGETVLVVNDREAFLSRYGEALADRIAGEYGEDSRLSNGGETITLVSRDGAVIDRVTYEDGSPWPGSADGEGASLERLALGGDGGPSNWMASAESGGTPGAVRPEVTYATWRRGHAFPSEPDGEPTADPDGDGHVNLAEYVAGSDPLEHDLGLQVVIMRGSEGDSFVLTYQRHPELGDVLLQIEGSSDLTNWLPQVVSEETREAGDGGLLRVGASVVASDLRWYRLRLSLEP